MSQRQRDQETCGHASGEGRETHAEHNAPNRVTRRDRCPSNEVSGRPRSKFGDKLIQEFTQARNCGKFEYRGNHSHPKLHVTGLASFLADDNAWDRWTKRLRGLEWKGHSAEPHHRQVRARNDTIVTVVTVASLDPFQAQPKWEISNGR